MNKEEKEQFITTTRIVIEEANDLRSQILIMHMVIEQLLNKLVEKNFKNPEIIFDNADLNGFSNKIDILNSVIGFEDRVIKAIKNVNTIRNIFSHQLFSDKNIPKDVENRIRTLSSIIIKSYRDVIDRKAGEGATDKIITGPTEMLVATISGIVTGSLLKML